MSLRGTGCVNCDVQNHSNLTCQLLPCLRLKESLAEALAVRDEARGHVTFDAEGPADKTLRVLENIMHGDEVSRGTV